MHRARRWSATPSSALAATPSATFVAAAPFARLTGHGRGTVACCPRAEHPRSGARRPPPARGMLHSYSPKRNRADERRSSALHHPPTPANRAIASGKDERGRVPKLRVSSSPTDPDAEFSVGPVFSRMSLLKRQSTSTLPHVLRRLHVRVRARTDRPGERCVRLPSKSRPLSTHDGLIRTPPRPDRGSNRGSNPSARLEPFSPAVRLLPGPPPSQSTHTAVTLSLTAQTLMVLSMYGSRLSSINGSSY